MPCFRPLTGFRSGTVSPTTGKRSIVFQRREALQDPLIEVTLPCGQCIGCRLEKSRQWAVRCMHEASLYESNCFLTLTYSDEFLPRYNSLDYDAPVLFMKRLRKEFGSDIRSYGCAEYGEKFSRPHYHLCIFNFDFPDKELWKKNGENSLFTSKKLQKLWPFGHSSCGSLTFESAAYVARYVTKKITGKVAAQHYTEIDPKYGEIRERLPERAICVSRRPGIGRTWFDQFGKNTFEKDFVILRGKKMRPPKYYDRLFDIDYPSDFATLKQKRREAGISASENVDAENTANYDSWITRYLKNGREIAPRDRLSIMEECQELKGKQLKRGFENED